MGGRPVGGGWCPIKMMILKKGYLSTRRGVLRFAIIATADIVTMAAAYYLFRELAFGGPSLTSLLIVIVSIVFAYVSSTRLLLRLMVFVVFCLINAGVGAFVGIEVFL
jgi:hypothetical protein